MNQPSPDILLIDDFLADHEALFQALKDEVDWDTSMKARQTASFGVPYNFSQMSYPERPIHPALQPVIAALKDRLQIAFNNCLLNYYTTGDSTMGFHSDDTSNLQPGTGVAIVSLGNARDLTYRSKSDHEIRRSFTLQPGSVLYMDSEVQDHWMHAVKKQKDAGPRISLTWRAFASP